MVRDMNRLVIDILFHTRLDKKCFNIMAILMRIQSWVFGLYML